MVTAQELFDNAALGIKWQGYRQASAYREPGIATCLLQMQDGRRCAIGHSVTDGQDRRASGQSAALHRRHPSLFSSIQAAHDNLLFETYDGPVAGAWRRQMSIIAVKFGLDDSALYFTEKT